jgi:hypothetical protein
LEKKNGINFVLEIGERWQILWPRAFLHAWEANQRNKHAEDMQRAWSLRQSETKNDQD